MTISIEYTNPEKDGKAILDMLIEEYGIYYDIFYQTDEFSSAIKNKKFISLVAKNGNEVVGHHGAYICNDLSKVVALVIKPEFRGKGISTLLENKMQDTILSQHSIKYVYGEIVANHTITQKAKYKQGFQAIGFYPQRHSLNKKHSLIPALWDIYENIKKDRHLIRICKSHEEISTICYSQFGVKVQNDPAQNKLPRTETTYSITILDDKRSTIQLTPGNNLNKSIEDIENETFKNGVKHVLIQLDASHLSTPTASQILSEHGYFFGSIKPQLDRKKPILSLQKVADYIQLSEKIIRPYQPITSLVGKESQKSNSIQI